MIVYRLTTRKYANDLSGTGASIFGYRWNSKGIHVIYTASSRALAMAEVWVHLPVGLTPVDYVMLEIDIPSLITIDSIDTSRLSSDWNDFPHRDETKELGDEFFCSGSGCVLKVPSAVVKGDYNFLINPKHSDMKFIKIVGIMEFPFDKRMLKNY